MTVPGHPSIPDPKVYIEAGKFPLVRWLSITSLLAMVLTATILILLYRQDQLAAFDEYAEEENERVLYHIIYSLDEELNTYISKHNGLDPRVTRDDPDLDSLFTSSLEQIKEHDILKLKLFNLSGKVIYSSVRTEIGGSSSKPELLQKALKGISASLLSHREKFSSTRAELQDVDIFETYMPLKHEGKNIGVIESYTDAAPVYDRLRTKTVQIILVVFGAFSGLYAALFLSVPKADRAVAQWQNQTETIDVLIHSMAFYDSLTHLPNRYLLHDRIAQSIAASNRSGCYSALLFLDMDNFKPLNDTHGHDAGDLLLVEAARRINRCVREVDTVARFGGDEFVVLLSELDCDKDKSLNQAQTVAEKIRITLSQPYHLQFNEDERAGKAIEHSCTASIGVVLFGCKANVEAILQRADKAMYLSKEAGRNSIRFCEEQV
jgi:diguanylate cyclase (GGDEF)-like protein